MSIFKDPLVWLAGLLVLLGAGLASSAAWGGWTAAAWGLVLAAAGAGLFWLRRRRLAADEQPIISLVLLLKEPRFLDAQVLAHAASRAWKTEFGVGEGDSCVVGESPLFILKWQERLFVVHNRDLPYFDDVEKIRVTINDLRIHHLASEQKAWLAIDQMTPDDDQLAYAHIGRLLAELFDSDCMAVFHPATSRIFFSDAETNRILANGSPLDELQARSYEPVVGIDPNDPRLKTAEREAQRRWGEFVTAFENRSPDQFFGVKAPISDGANTEFVWLQVTSLENDVIYGTLQSDPVQVQRQQKQVLRVRLPDMSDWVYSQGDDIVGFFSRGFFAEWE